jgi:hypothetical protein
MSLCPNARAPATFGHKLDANPEIESLCSASAAVFEN